jgi:hypothetical protein
MPTEGWLETAVRTREWQQTHNFDRTATEVGLKYKSIYQHLKYLLLEIINI